jgi:excisionase family DNA binding protein
LTVTTPLTAAQAATLLGVSVRTLDRYIEQGRITPKRTPGGHRRFDPADVIRLLEPAE